MRAAAADVRHGQHLNVPQLNFDSSCSLYSDNDADCAHSVSLRLSISFRVQCKYLSRSAAFPVFALQLNANAAQREIDRERVRDSN